MAIARQMHREADTWLPRFKQTGELDRESFDRMVHLRHALLSATPTSALDRLMQFGTMRSLLSFMFGVFNLGEDESAEALTLLHGGLTEIALGFIALQPSLESDAGQTLEGLGLFTSQTSLN